MCVIKIKIKSSFYSKKALHPRKRKARPTRVRLLEYIILQNRVISYNIKNKPHSVEACFNRL